MADRAAFRAVGRLFAGGVVACFQFRARVAAVQQENDERLFPELAIASHSGGAQSLGDFRAQKLVMANVPRIDGFGLGLKSALGKKSIVDCASHHTQRGVPLNATKVLLCRQSDNG